MTNSSRKLGLMEKVFESSEWCNIVKADGFLPFLCGSDLTKLDKEGSWVAMDKTEEPIYLALGLTHKEHTYPNAIDRSGLPHKDLFFKCLKRYKWSNEQRRDILLHDANIMLNISQYYTEDIHQVNTACITRLGQGVIGEDKFVPGLALSLGDEEATGVRALHLDVYLFFILEVWGITIVWQFYDPEDPSIDS
ncbi:Uu.00g137050.m01.CDS01 [Anthostomella pinea]|uniref:Uu.00g137050.m01.CDS01 n=1 Tax=Anthostomella pinea TaxID=933095 RepID=A0AAI8VJ08_9PEZI|nr:Uu.00g137050.m01.CDS01 [Anthostomella pinea]